MRFSKLPLAMLTAAGMCLGSPVFGNDEPVREGLIRISDEKPVNAPTPDPVSTSGAVSSSGVVVSSGEACEEEDEACCNLPTYHWPDYGYARIVKYAIHRMPIQYYRYWPARWYGEPGSGIAPHALRFPVIYQPTDTTQLGVYYQRVPQWLPNPAMLPPAPWPTTWHRRECPYGNSYDPNSPYAMQGPVNQSSEPTPVDAKEKSAEPAPPPPTQDVPPAPEKSAYRGGYQQSQF